MRHTTLLLVLCGGCASPGERAPVPVRPGLERAIASIDLRGPFQEYIHAVTQEWIKPLPRTNPALLQMFADRDTTPYRKLLPWSGEFAGKYLTGAVQVLRLTGDPGLREHLREFVGRLVALQAEDGYLGPFPKDHRLTGRAPNAGDTWDAWGHYHAMLGLLLWHDEDGDGKALACAVRIGDLLCAKFLGTGLRVVQTGSTEMNQAVIHSLCLLHRKTGTLKYLELARQVRDEFAEKGAGDYLRSALAGKEFFQCPKPRWESLHPILGLAELYRLDGDEDARRAFEHLWWSIVKLDRHNNGGFSSGEQAQGNPYHPGAIETCCTIAWIAMSVEMLRLTGESVVADEIELSTLNSVAGYQSRTGKWCTYNTPMDGVRRKSTDDIGFQNRPGSEEINCCSANAPRGFGMIGDWALMTDGRAGLTLNWYGRSTMTSTAGGTRVTLRQETSYPRDGRIRLEVYPEIITRFPLRLRIPTWSARTGVFVNGEAVTGATPCTYLTIDRVWTPGTRVEIDLDFSPHFWSGERECAGKVSIFRGPILLTQSRRPGPAIAFGAGWKKYGDLWAASTVGASLEATFEGTGVAWRGKKFDDAGRAQVSIDGLEIAVVDQFGPGRDLPFSWEHTGLPPGKHTIRIAVRADKEAASKGTFINITGFAAPGGDQPELDARTLDLRPVEDPGALVLVEAADADGRRIQLRDFATAGENGAEYVSWLKVAHAPSAGFSRNNPLRSARP